MKKSAILFILLLASVGFSMQAQETLLKGVVVNAKYHTSVPYAVLFIQGTAVGTVADNIGEFSLVVPDSLTGGRLMIVRSGFKLTVLSLD